MARRCRTRTRAPAKKKQNMIRAVELNHPGNKVAQEGAKMQKDMAGMGRKTSLAKRPRW
jgi:hypothetical protein